MASHAWIGAGIGAGDTHLHRPFRPFGGDPERAPSPDKVAHCTGCLTVRTVHRFSVLLGPHQSPYVTGVKESSEDDVHQYALQ